MEKINRHYKTQTNQTKTQTKPQTKQQKNPKQQSAVGSRLPFPGKSFYLKPVALNEKK